MRRPAIDIQLLGFLFVMLILPSVGRVSICDEEGRTVLDEFVLPDMPVTDFRFHITGMNAGKSLRAHVLRAFSRVTRPQS